MSFHQTCLFLWTSPWSFDEKSLLEFKHEIRILLFLFKNAILRIIYSIHSDYDKHFLHNYNETFCQFDFFSFSCYLLSTLNRPLFFEFFLSTEFKQSQRNFNVKPLANYYYFLSNAWKRDNPSSGLFILYIILVHFLRLVFIWHKKYQGIKEVDNSHIW